MKRWLEVSLSIPREVEESVSNFLMEQGAAGIEEVEVDPKTKKLKSYFSQDKKEKGILTGLRRYLKSLQRIDPRVADYGIETTSIREQDWGENWKKFFKPLRVGSRFLIKPPWAKTKLRTGQIPIVITPGMAFGTGTHATTRLCIEALEEKLESRGLSVLDVGTGSGILSIVAAKLGSPEVKGLDTDEVAVGIAEENVRRNGVAGIAKIRKGSIGDIKRRFDIIVANIDFKGLRRLRSSLLGRLKERGSLILSGILAEEGERLRQHYLETGHLRSTGIVQKGEWVCLTFEKIPQDS